MADPRIVVIRPPDEPKRVVVREPAPVGRVRVVEGIRGPAGASGLVYYEHTQVFPEPEWLVQHNLGFYPGGISCVDFGGTQIEGDVYYLDVNSFVVKWASPNAGKCFVS